MRAAFLAWGGHNVETLLREGWTVRTPDFYAGMPLLPRVKGLSHGWEPPGQTQLTCGVLLLLFPLLCRTCGVLAIGFRNVIRVRPINL